jgi:HAE1 family hydrophobic/amphiphilic exporter-1
VFVIPGLYYIFGRIAEKYKLVKNEEENPWTEEIDNNEVHK